MRVIGMGLTSAATVAEVAAAMAAAGGCDLLAIPALRAGHPALRQVTLPCLAVPEGAVAGIPTPTQSPRILARFGCGSVAEAVALVASRGRIITPRQSHGAVTWAVAEGPGPEEEATQ